MGGIECEYSFSVLLKVLLTSMTSYSEKNVNNIITYTSTTYKHVNIILW